MAADFGVWRQAAFQFRLCALGFPWAASAPITFELRPQLETISSHHQLPHAQRTFFTREAIHVN